MNMDELGKEMERLVRTMAILRGPEGCPWDKKQDYYSLQPYIIEEAYEVVEALQKKDINLLKEELGDLLLQVVFQAQIASESGDFDLADVFRVISDKLIRRHPHVFQEQHIDSVEHLKAVWEEIKRKEKGAGEQEPKSLLDHVSRSNPALIQSYQVQEKAAQVGFDWDNINDVVTKIKEELLEVTEAIQDNNEQEVFEEIGDLLFAVVNLARFKGINPELALLKTVLKFKDRFSYIEKRVAEKGFKLEELTLNELDAFWEESKDNII